MNRSSRLALVQIVTRNDKIGKEILKSLQINSLSTDYIQKKSKYPTGTAMVELNEKGIPNYMIKENVAWDYIEMNRNLDTLAKKCNAVYFGTLAQRCIVSQQAIIGCIKNVLSSTIRIFDINLRQKYYSDEIIDSSLNLASVLKLNDDELSKVASIFGYTGSAESILSNLISNFDLMLIALTRGSEGSVLVSLHQISTIKPETVSLVDTVGAGDAFTAGLVYGLLMDFELDTTNRIANQLASFVCTKKGATPKLEKGILDRITNG